MYKLTDQTVKSFLFPNYLTDSLNLPNIVLGHSLIGTHLPVVSTILVHLRSIIGQKWGRSGL